MYLGIINLWYDAFLEFSINNSIQFQFICGQWSNFAHLYHDENSNWIKNETFAESSSPMEYANVFTWNGD